MTRIENLPVDNYEISSTEQKILDLLFPNVVVKNDEAESPQDDTEKQEVICCSESTPIWWTIIMDILLLIMGILLFEMKYWSEWFNVSENTLIIIKLLSIIVLIICVKKFLLC